MKKNIVITLILICCVNFHSYPQEITYGKFRHDEPVRFIPKNHDPDFAKRNKLPAKSFYKSRPDWQHIIDSTWGPGDSLSQKLLIFNTYAQKVHDQFDGFLSLQLNWDSLYNHFLSQISESTSKGAFSSIMSHFAYELKDVHTYAYDTTVLLTPLNPGIPVLLIGNFNSAEHFGVITTVLPDSTTLVLRAAPDHPLNLEPGDIILGYEGVPWKILIKELLDAGLPMYASTGGCKSADTYHNLMGVGLNWHLFDTIDILKYSIGDTVHLSVLPLLNLDLLLMMNNEQLAIPNIPFPNVTYLEPDTCVTFGVLENTNIGYIFLAMEWPTTTADEQFYEAVNALKNTDALIIDMRLNLGGWALFDKAFEILFNEYHRTIEDAYRCNANTFELCTIDDWEYFIINVTAPDAYERPIAVLLGPSCVSMGDITAQRLRYHPMVRFFGSSPDASLGDNSFITDYPDWIIRYSICDPFHISEPGAYLNRAEFPLNYPVWFNKEDVAIGKDPVVEKSLDWIKNLVYGHNATTDKSWYSPGKDTMIVNAIIENPGSHQISARLYIESLDGSVKDSVEMTGPGLLKGAQWQGKWAVPAPPEHSYWLSLMAKDITDGTSFASKHSTRISTIPLLFDSLIYAPVSATKSIVELLLKNAGTGEAINKLGVRITSDDSWVKSIMPSQKIYDTLLPGQTVKISKFMIMYDTSAFPGYFNLRFTFSSNGWTHWITDTVLTIIPHGIVERSHSAAFCLDQNRPNPFNSLTRFSFSLPERSFGSLTVYDLRGIKVATIVSGEFAAGNHFRDWNAAGLPGGIYYYRLQAGADVETKKLVLIE